MESGGIDVKARLLVLFMMCACMLLPSAVVQAAVMDLSDKHCSIDVPAGWSSQRNYTMVGVVYDLWIEGPVTNGYKTIVTLLIGPWPGAISDATLYAQMVYSIQELRTSYGSTNVQIVSAPANITLNGEHSSDATLLVTASGVTIRERLVIVVSGEWKQLYGLALAVVDSQWNMYASTFQAIINSLTVTEKGNAGGGLSAPVVAGIGLVAVVVIVVVLIATRKKRQPTGVLLSPPQVSPPPVQIYPPTPPSGVQRFCPYCGSQIAPGAGSCSNCGRGLA